MARRIIALGRGYIGQAFEAAGIPVYSRKLKWNYTDPCEMESILCDTDVVINCAGFTGRPNIDECEVKRRETVEANVVLPANLSRVSKAMGARFVHISSGCIFQGSGNYDESEPPAANLSFYSQTKAMAEEVVEGLILRIRMPFDHSSHPRSLLTKLASYPKLINYENSLTYIPDLVMASTTWSTAARSCIGTLRRRWDGARNGCRLRR